LHELNDQLIDILQKSVEVILEVTCPFNNIFKKNKTSFCYDATEKQYIRPYCSIACEVQRDNNF